MNADRRDGGAGAMQVTGSERRLERALASRWLVLTALAAACGLAAPARAAAQSVTVTVDIAGTGGGTVTSNPAGINCTGSNTSCSAGFTGGAAVTLTATPTSGHTFLGWIGICSGTGTCQFNAIDGALAVAQFDSPTAAAVTYYHLDAIGSVRALTDGSGNVLIRHDYLPFGEDTQAMAGDPLRFTGQEIDAESGLHYFQARQYRQWWGRFTTVDPGHVNGSLEDPQGWNGYAYGRNNPLKYVDPEGLAYRVCPDSSTECLPGLMSQQRYDDLREGRGGIWWTDGEPWAEQADLYRDGRKYGELHYVLDSEDLDYALEQTHRTAGPTVNFLGALGVGFAAAGIAADGLLAWVGRQALTSIPRIWYPQLPIPAVPAGMTLAEFGRRLGWGTGTESARAAISALTREGLRDIGVTREMAEAWVRFYGYEAIRNAGNPSAPGRKEFMEAASKLLR